MDQRTHHTAPCGVQPSGKATRKGRTSPRASSSGSSCLHSARLMAVRGPFMVSHARHLIDGSVSGFRLIWRGGRPAKCVLRPRRTSTSCPPAGLPFDLHRHCRRPAANPRMQEAKPPTSEPPVPSHGHRATCAPCAEAIERRRGERPGLYPTSGRLAFTALLLSQSDRGTAEGEPGTAQRGERVSERAFLESTRAHRGRPRKLASSP